MIDFHCGPLWAQKGIHFFVIPVKAYQLMSIIKNKRKWKGLGGGVLLGLAFSGQSLCPQATREGER